MELRDHVRDAYLIGERPVSLLLFVYGFLLFKSWVPETRRQASFRRERHVVRADRHWVALVVRDFTENKRPMCSRKKARAKISILLQFEPTIIGLRWFARDLTKDKCASDAVVGRTSRK